MNFMNFKKILSVTMMLLISVQSMAQELSGYDGQKLSKDSLEKLTRGGVINKRFSSKSIRILCEDQNIKKDQACLKFGFYATEKIEHKTYLATKIGEKTTSFSLQETINKLVEISNHNRIHKNDMENALMIILAIFLPILIIPIGIAVIANDIGNSIRNSRVKSTNKRLARFEEQFAKGRSRDITLSSKKFQLAERAFSFSLLNY